MQRVHFCGRISAGNCESALLDEMLEFTEKRRREETELALVEASRLEAERVHDGAAATAESRKTTATTFDEIYTSNKWSSAETRSGEGSEITCHARDEWNTALPVKGDGKDGLFWRVWRSSEGQITT